MSVDDDPDDTGTTDGTERTTEDEGSRAAADTLARYLQLGAVAVLSLLTLIATFRLYQNGSRAVSLWVSPAYEPFFQAGFNLVVVLISVSAVAFLLDRVAD